MSAARIAIKRAATLLRSASASSAFSTNRHGASGLLSDPAAAAAATSASYSGPLVYSNRRGQVLPISQFVVAIGKLPFPVDTPALVKRMEAQEVPPKQAEVIAEVLKDSLERVAQPFAWIGVIEKEHLSSIVQRETQKLLGHNKKMHFGLISEIRATSMLSEFRFNTQKMLSDFRVGGEKLHSELRVELEKSASDSWNKYGELRAELEKMSIVSRKRNSELRVILDDAEYTAQRDFICIFVSVAGIIGLGACFAVIRIMMQDKYNSFCSKNLFSLFEEL